VAWSLGAYRASALERERFKLNRRRALDLRWSMIFSENRHPPIGSKPEGMLFRIML
jgi:hypothetical protein